MFTKNMPSKCFVPGCKSGYVLQKKENDRAGIRNPSLFSAPKDNQLLEEWSRMILRKDKILTTKDKVCELHFEEECILKEYVILMPDGTLYKTPKGLFTLKKGSIPSIFPNLPTYVSMRNTERKDSIPLTGSFENELNIFENDSESIDFVIPEQLNDFLKFSVDAKNIITPNSLWSVANIEDCILFAKWNQNYSPERRVVVCKDLSTKVFLMNVELSLPIESCTVENIAELLQKVNDFKICSNADSKISSGCFGVLEDKKGEFCNTCYKSKKNEKETGKRNAKPLVSKKTKTVNQLSNSCFRKKVPDVKKSRLKLSKYQYSQIRRKPS